MHLAHTRYVPANNIYVVSGPDAFVPAFVDAVKSAAKKAPPVSYDGEAFVCGDQRLLSESARNRWIQQKMQAAGYLGCSAGDVAEALWQTSIKSNRVR